MKRKTIYKILIALVIVIIAGGIYVYDTYQAMGLQAVYVDETATVAAPEAGTGLHAVAQGTSDWLNWRGPDFHGKSSMTGLKTDWSTGLTKLWSLYADGNQLASIAPVAKLSNLSSLDLRNNQVADLGPVKGLTELRYLLLNNNKVTDLQVLVEMAQKDSAGEKRFAPFWHLYLQGNPLSDAAQNKQLAELKKVGSRVHLKD